MLVPFEKQADIKKTLPSTSKATTKSFRWGSLDQAKIIAHRTLIRDSSKVVPLLTPQNFSIQSSDQKKKTLLPPGFEKALIEHEFNVEWLGQQATKDQVLLLISMYTQAAENYDRVQDRSLAEIYRMKLQMLFTKP